MNKTCSKCNETKSLNEFYNVLGGKYGKRRDCRECMTSIRAAKRVTGTTPERLMELFTLSDDGVFTKIATKKVLNFMKVKGYIVISIDGVTYQAHRLVWLWHHGEFPENEIDHINHRRADNRIENLRLATQQENSRNKSKYKTNTSGVTGVYWHKATGKWMPSIKYNGKSIYLGLFQDKDEAVRVRKKAEVKYGFHENHGST